MTCYLRRQTWMLMVWILGFLVSFTSIQRTAYAIPDVTIRGATFAPDGGVSTFWHDNGIHFLEGPSPSFVCKDALPSMTMGLRTGVDRMLVAGEEGAFLTLSLGCKWKQTGGVYSFDEVVGLYRDDTDSDRVLIVYADKGSVALSLDGGHTTETAPILSVSNVDFDKMVSRGPSILITGRSRLDQTRLYWWSADAGYTFSSGTLGEGDDLRPWTLHGTQAWLTEGLTLLSLDLETGDVVVGPQLSATPISVAMDSSGVLWFALGESGLWSMSGDGAADVTLQRSQPASWIAWRYDALWLGTVVSSWEDPALLRRTSEAAGWKEYARIASDLAPSEGCVTLNSQICAESVKEWKDGFTVPSDVTELDGSEDLAESGGCTIASDQNRFWFLLYVALWLALRRCVRHKRVIWIQNATGPP